MRITLQSNFTQQNNQPNFKQKYLIQIPKSAFPNPDDLSGVCQTMDEAVFAITKDKDTKVRDFLTKLGLGSKLHKTVGFLEYPAYVPIKEELQKMGRSRNWLSKETGVQLKGPQSQTHHSFYVYTKQEKDHLLNSVLSVWGEMGIHLQLIKKTVQEHRIEDTPSLAESMARVNQLMVEKLQKITNGKPAKKFVIDDLSQLPKVFEKIDY